MFKIYCVSLLFTLLFTSCAQNDKLETRLTPIMKNDTISNIPLHDAVRAKDINKVKEIVSDGFLLNTQDKADFTALHLAVRFDQYDISEYLINKKVSVNTFDIYGDTPLLESMRNKTDDISKLLLCNGANKDVKDRNLLSPLDYAKLDNNESMIKILESSDIKPFCKEKEIVTVQRAEEKPSKDSINKETNITILINIHHDELALEYADRIIGIHAGEIVYDGPSNLVTQEVLDKIYASSPAEREAMK